jgi:predicted nucleotidyltransferase component of viral defense system
MVEVAAFGLYPSSFADLERWAAQHRTTMEEARRRFVQFVVLDALADGAVARLFAFKGGNALRFGYGSPRSTLDLDFTGDGSLDDVAVLRPTVDAAVRSAASRFEARCKVTHAKRNPPRGDRPTYSVHVGFQLPGDRRYADFLLTDATSSQVVYVEISMNDAVCEVIAAEVGPGTGRRLRLCSLEDIIAEKLRAILQQVVRNRSRPQDVYDIARAYRIYGPDIDFAKVLTFF